MFIAGSCTIVAPLQRLTHLDVDFKWGPPKQAALDQLTNSFLSWMSSLTIFQVPIFLLGGFKRFNVYHSACPQLYLLSEIRFICLYLPFGLYTVTWYTNKTSRHWLKGIRPNVQTLVDTSNVYRHFKYMQKVQQ